jgi:molybdate transport system substrate-binding protein
VRQLVLVAVLVLAGCGAGTASTSSASADRSSATAATSLRVYAAASLKGALTKIEPAYETAHGGVTLAISTDSSAALETKIEQGAPADVFLSADTANPQKLVDHGLSAGSVVPFASNRLTVIVPTTNPASITSPGDLAKSGVKVIAAGPSVPITQYANQLVEKLATLPASPRDFAARYEANIVSREDNVAAIVTKVALGEGDAGIVYATDAKTSASVAAVTIPDAANITATYGGVVLAASSNPAQAADFLRWVAGPDGQAILRSFGFLPPS